MRRSLKRVSLTETASGIPICLLIEDRLALHEYFLKLVEIVNNMLVVVEGRDCGRSVMMSLFFRFKSKRA